MEEDVNDFRELRLGAKNFTNATYRDMYNERVFIFYKSLHVHNLDTIVECLDTKVFEEI